MNRLFKVGEVLPLHEPSEIFRLLIPELEHDLDLAIGGTCSPLVRILTLAFRIERVDP